jgi:hypothetical protein
MTKASVKYKDVHEALNYIIMSTFRIDDVLCVRIGKGNATLGNISDIDHHMTMYW